MFLSHWIRSVANQLQHSPASPFPSDQTLALGLTRLEDRRVLSVSGADVMLFSVEGAAVTLPGNVQAEGADIVAYDGSEFQLYLDGSDVGLSGADIDGFAVAGENQFLLSFANATTVAGLGTVDSRDIIQFSASSVGEDTAGTFSWVLHGENFGLPELPPGNIDALEVLDDGSIVFSIAGNSSLPIGPDDGMVSTQDSDLFRLTPDANGDFAMANLELYFDGSDVGLSGTIEDVDAVAINGSQWRFSTTSSFFVNGQTLGSGGDVFTFNAVKLGDATSGTFDPGLDFDGSMVTGLGFNLDALDFATITPPNAPPSAQDVSADVSEDGSVAVQLLGNDGDVNADQPLTYQIVDGPDFGQVSNFDPATGTLTYTPNADYAGSDQIVYLVQETDADGNVLSSEVATVSLTVNAVNDAPILQVAQSQFSGNEGQSIVIHGLAVDDLEAVSQQSQVVVTLQAGDGALSLAESTSVAITGNGSGEVQLTGTVADINLLLAQGVTFQPNAEFAGTSAVSITLQDDVNAGNALVTTASLQLQILAIPDQPSPITFQERVLQLLGNAELNFGQANTLLNAIRHEGGHGLADKAAHKVEKWERQGRIGSELADELVGWLQDLDANADGHHHHHGHKHGHHKHSHDHHGHNLAHGHHGHHHNHKNDHGHGHKAGHDHHHGPLHNLVDAIFSQIANGRHCGRFRV